MTERIVAHYDSFDRARIAREDLLSAGVEPSEVSLLEMDTGETRLTVSSTSEDRTINVHAFLAQDGASSVEVGASDVVPDGTVG